MQVVFARVLPLRTELMTKVVAHGKTVGGRQWRESVEKVLDVRVHDLRHLKPAENARESGVGQRREPARKVVGLLGRHRGTKVEEHLERAHPSERLVDMLR
jgi:hypothetical protein